jgi:predicted nucleic acid-binding protein
VKRVIVLDSGPLGLACDNPRKAAVEQITLWRIRARANSAILMIPEIADYEVRRELLRVGAHAGLRRLDRLRGELEYAPISTPAMERAAQLWAEARRRGTPTSDDKRLDGDVILAAQALVFAGLNDVLTVATENVAHLSQFVHAQTWSQIDE